MLIIEIKTLSCYYTRDYLFNQIREQLLCTTFNLKFCQKKQVITLKNEEYYLLIIIYCAALIAAS